MKLDFHHKLFGYLTSNCICDRCAVGSCRMGCGELETVWIKEKMA